MADYGYKVSLNVYDLSQGLARQLSTTFLGKAIEGIWHTGVVVYGNEYYFGGGIQHAPAGTTQYGTPIKVIDLGVTHVPKDVFEMYLEEISPRYTAETYNLLKHNCNNFTNEVAQFLVGGTVPDYIMNLPNEVLSSPMGAMILPMIQQLEATMRAGAVPQAPQFRPAVQVNAALSTTANNSSGGGAAAAAEVKPRSLPSKEQSPKDKSVPTAVETAGAGEEKSSPVKGVDPLGNARNKVQEEISAEFAAIMATGTLRASEAAALATRKVMERYGHISAAKS